jgi:hypothetical protein
MLSAATNRETAAGQTVHNAAWQDSEEKKQTLFQRKI